MGPLHRLAALALLAALHAGCAAPAVTAPRSMAVAPGAYLQVFETATAVAREVGLEPSFRDPRGGILEAGPARVPSALEPWAQQGPDPTAEATLAQERRRLRVEFLEPGAAPAGAIEDIPALDLLAVRTPPRDLTTAGVPLEMHVIVVIERLHDPGVRRGTWSRTTTHHVGGVDPPYWWPERRDPAYEAWLVERILERSDEATKRRSDEGRESDG